MRDPISALGITAEAIPPFVRVTGELMDSAQQAEPELLALISSRGFDYLKTLNEEQVRPLIEQAKKDRADRVNREHIRNLMHAPHYAAAYNASVQRSINDAEGARLDITAQAEEVRGEGASEQGQPTANPTREPNAPASNQISRSAADLRQNPRGPPLQNPSSLKSRTSRWRRS